MKKTFFIPVGIFLVLVVSILFFSVKSAGNSKVSTPVLGVGGGDSREEIQPAKATQNLNKSFTFPLKDTTGKNVSTFTYTLDTAEKRDEILIKGQRATSIKGRTILVINIKIKNAFDKPVQINAADYVRLSVNNSTDRLAPDISNDPVTVQPISTKDTRIGFPISDTDKNLILYVGEISGKKEPIKLSL